ncbi:Ku protein [Streptomyces sp. NPDC020875]|uniref:non-homologous end joining protein Ku n=1 Tax=Streptomyces sp. NPDC020875 TaxID=3154898 RepID=UPI0034019026
MPRPVWAGAISFGLVTIPVKVLTATEDRSIRFHQYHVADMGRIRTRKVCELDGRVLRQDEIGKGYEVSADEVVPLTDEELDELPLPTAKAIEIAAFVPAGSIDPVRISDSYYLAADGQVAAKPYVLLRRALDRSEKAAVAKFAWHGRERLGLLRVRGDAIVLHALKWPDEVRSPASLAPPKTELDEDEVDRALALMDTMAADDASGYRDHYREALENLIPAKSKGRAAAPAQAPEAELAGQVVDLMAALNASVEKAREQRGEPLEAEATVHDLPRRTTKKKTPPRKTATAKSGATKTAAGKKTTARRPKKTA